MKPNGIDWTIEVPTGAVTLDVRDHAGRTETRLSFKRGKWVDVDGVEWRLQAVPTSSKNGFPPVVKIVLEDDGDRDDLTDLLRDCLQHIPDSDLRDRITTEVGHG